MVNRLSGYVVEYFSYGILSVTSTSEEAAAFFMNEVTPNAV